MPLAEAALGFVAAQVLDQIAGQALSAAGGESSRRVRAWLGRDPQQIACQVALARTEERFLTRYPELHSALFDEHFLKHGAAPVLARTLKRGEPPSAQELASAWAAQFGSATDASLRDPIEPAAADFLRWWREELGQHEAFRPLLDSTALDRLADASVELTDLTRALGALDRALLRARYPALEDYVDWPSRRSAGRPPVLVGREWLFERLQEVTSAAPAGYVSVVADAGLGKTAFALAVAGRFDAPVFLFNEAAGRVHADRCLAHLCVELIDRRSLAYDRLPDRAGEDPGFLAKLLEEAAHGGPVWIVIDALDEAPTLPLPDELPAGVFVLLTHRPGDYAPLVAPGADTVVRELHIRAADQHQRDDVAAYLRRRSDEADLRAALDRLGVGVDAFVQRLAAAADGNFMYAAYVVDELVQGATLELSSLPRGLTAYYERFWRAMSDAADGDWDTWERLQLPVIELLAVAAEPITSAWMADVTGRSPAEIQRRALRAWRRFLAEEDGAWRIVHQSFREFLAKTGDVDLQAAHARVAAHFLERWTEHGGYASRHLTAHLRLAGDRSALFALVDRGGWREAQIAYDPSGSTYRRDLSEAWDEATAANQEALGAGRPPQLLRELLFAIATAEQQSRVVNAPAELLVRLMETGRWSDSQALAAAASLADPVKRTEALTLLAARSDGAARRRAAAAAAAAAYAVRDDAARVRSLTALLPLVGGIEHARLQERRGQALAQALAGGGAFDDRDRANQLSALADVLAAEERPAAIEAAVAIVDPRARLWALLEVGAPEPQLSAAARNLRAIGTAWELYQTIVHIAARAPEGLLGDLLDVTVELSDPLRRWALNKLAPRLAGDVAARALTVTEGTDDPRDRFVTRALLGAGLDEPEFWSMASAVGSTAYEFWGLQLDRARHLLRPPWELPTVMGLAVELDDILSTSEESSQAGAFLAALAPRLGEPQLRDAFALTRDMPEQDRARALEGLAPFLPDDLVWPAFDAAVEAGAAHALAAVARRLPDPLPDTAIFADPIPAARLSERQLADALEWTSAIAWETPSLFEEAPGPGLVARLAPHLPESLLPAALEALAVSSTRGSALSESIDALGEHERPEAARLAVAAAAGDPEVEPFAVAAAAPHLPEVERNAALRSALAATKHVNPEFRTSALTELIPQLDEPERRSAIERLDSAGLMPYMVESTLAYLSDADIDRLLHTGADAGLVAAFAPRLSTERALSLILALVDDEDEEGLVGDEDEGALVDDEDEDDEEALYDDEETPAAFAALVPRLDEASRAALLEQLQQREAVHELTVVAEALPPETRAPWLAAALVAAHRMADPGAKAQALLQLVPQLSGTERDAAIEAAHAATTEIANFAQRVHCARAVAELLPEDEGGRLAAFALDQVPADHRVACIAHLAPVLGAQRDIAVASAFAEATARPDPVDRAMLFVELAPHLPDGLANDALADALLNPHPDARLLAIAAFAPRLDDERLAELLGSFREPLSYARGIADLVAYLGPCSAGAALKLTGRITDPGERAQALSALSDVPYLDISALHAQLSETLRAAAQLGESDLYGGLLQLQPAIARVGTS